MNQELMQQGWEKIALGDIATVKGGKRLPKGFDLVSIKTKHPYIRITDLENSRINKDQLMYVAEDVFPYISKYIVNSGDLIISIVGSIGSVAKIDDDLNHANLTENCVKLVDLKNIDTNFLFYFLISKQGQNEIIKNTVGAVQKKLPIYGVQNIIVPLPPLSEQCEIAAVLSCLDDKIELLREQNWILGEMAQRLFREWFVEFNFPDEEGRPYRASGGKMVDSELGEIPEGWRVGRLGEEFDITIGRTPPRNEKKWFSSLPLGKKWISIKDIGNSGAYIFETSEYLTDEAIKKFNIPVIPENTTILSFKMTVGKLTITTEEMLSNEAVAHLKTKNDSVLSTEFIYSYLQNLDFNSLGSTSSIVTAINSRMIKNIEIILPDEKTLCQFCQTVQPIFAKIRNNSSQTKNISLIRNMILPKLMNHYYKF